LKVYYDHQIFSLQRFGGVSKYFSELIDFYASRRCLDVQVGGRFYICEHLSGHKGKIRIPKFRGDRRLCAYLNDCFEMGIAADLLHSTYYSPKYLQIGGKTRRVITIHDMIPEKYPEFFSSNPHKAKRAYVDVADRIICVSESTKNDLLKYFKVSEQKIDVIHHGVDFEHTRNDISAVAVPKNYVVYVGRRDGYKNFEVLLRAMKQLWDTGSDLSLVCVGGGRFTEHEIESVRHQSSKIFQISANDKQVRYIIKMAVVLVMTLPLSLPNWGVTGRSSFLGRRRGNPGGIFGLLVFAP
jgi:glycosyltransferase involved in cell wall biosynthesis